MIKPSEISDILKKQLDEVDSKINFEEVGTVLEVGDGVAHVYGLENVRSSELIEFENGVHGVAKRAMWVSFCSIMSIRLPKI